MEDEKILSECRLYAMYNAGCNDCALERVGCNVKCEKYDEAYRYKMYELSIDNKSNNDNNEEPSDTQMKIHYVCDSIEKVLQTKNKKYGNSALKPLGIFSRNDSESSICIRIDDKLGRVRNSAHLRKNDVFDLIGYLTLLCVQKGWTNFDELID